MSAEEEFAAPEIAEREEAGACTAGSSGTRHGGGGSRNAQIEI